MNDQDLIFEQYLNIVLDEAVYAGSQFGIKKGAGAHKRGVSVTTPEEEIRHKDTRFQRNIASSIEQGNLINILDLLADDFGGRDKARSVLMRYLRTDNINTKSQYNPFPEHPNIGPFVVPTFRLPDVISAIKSATKLVETPTEKKLMSVLFNKLASIYEEQFGGNANDDTELNAIRSFVTRFINRTFRDGGERKVLQQVTFGGKSARDDFNQVFITNTKELEGPNWDRLKKITNKLFTGEERFNPDESGSETYLPQRQTPENLAGITLADPDRNAHQDRLRDTETTEPTKKPSTKKPSTKKPPTKKPSTKKPPTKKPPTKKSPTKKSPTKKKTVTEESFKFIKVIPF